MTFEAGKTYETGGDDGDAMVAHVFPDGDLLCIRGDDSWRCYACGGAIDGDFLRRLIAPKPEPRRVTLAIFYGDGPARLTECLIGPDGALRVV